MDRKSYYNRDVAYCEGAGAEKCTSCYRYALHLMCKINENFGDTNYVPYIEPMYDAEIDECEVYEEYKL